MAVDSRNIALPIAGFCTFLNLYSPQALLPTLSREFGVGVAEISDFSEIDVLCWVPPATVSRLQAGQLAVVAPDPDRSRVPSRGMRENRRGSPCACRP